MSETVGGEVRDKPAEVVTFSASVRRGAGMSLVLLRDGDPARVTSIAEDEKTVKLEQPVGAGGHVSAELMGSPELEREKPAGRMPEDGGAHERDLRGE